MAKETCSACGGSGLFGDMSKGEKCQHCYGTGMVDAPTSSHSSGGHSGSGGSGCFTGCTKVLTPKGWIRIDQISANDIVLAVSGESEFEEAKVSKVIVHPPQNVINVETSHASIDVTDIHAIKTERGWIRAGKAKVGENLVHLTSEGDSKVSEIKSIKNNGKVEPVYNLIVEKHYTFVVDGCLAHSFSYFRQTRIILSELVRVFSLITSKVGKIPAKLDSVAE